MSPSDVQLRSPSACPDLDTLEAFQLGRLPEPGLAVVADHLALCPSCGSALVEVQRRLLESDSLLARLRDCFGTYPHLDEAGCGQLERAARAIPLARAPRGEVTVAESASTPVALAGSGSGTAETGEARDAPLPAAIGSYLVEERIGRGGMGVVYRARQQPFGRPVAVKMISAGVHAGANAQARFRVEGEAISRLAHPHVVQIHEFGDHDGVPYYSMELVDGGSLASRLQDGPLPVRDAAVLVQKLAGAVDYAHRSHVLHRDLKPANILLTAAGEPKIADFGLAKLLDEEDGQTCSDVILGTPSYMAPEQAEARVADIGPVTDVYALGTILYQALTGRPPFKGASKAETLRQVVRSAAVPPGRLRREVPRALEAVCLKCLEKDPRRRYPSAQALADDLGRFLRGEPTVARPPRWPARLGRWARRYAVALGAAAVLVTVLAVLYVRDPERLRRNVEHALARGQEVTLITETGPPGFYHLVTGEAWTQAARAADGTFRVKTSSVALVELLPDSQCDAYRVRAEVRHEPTDNARGTVGVYVAGHELAGSAPPIYTYVQLVYNDVSAEPAAVPLDHRRPAASGLIGALAAGCTPSVYGYLPLVYTKVRSGSLPPQNRPRLEVSGLIGAPAEGGTPRNLPLLFGPRFDLATYAPIPLKAPRWRELELLVTPASVRARWAGQDFDATRADWLPKLLEVQRHMGIQAAPAAAYATPAYQPRGALGLILFRATASFRNVTVTPLGAAGAGGGR